MKHNKPPRPRRALSQRQIRAIQKAQRLGRRLQRDLGDTIEILYRRHIPQTTIVEELALAATYTVGPEVARTAVHYALAGQDGRLGIEPYAGLITDEQDLAAIRLAIARATLSSTERSEFGKQGYAQALGKLTPEELSAQGIAGAKSRGLTPWTRTSVPGSEGMSEVVYAHHLSTHPDYTRQQEPGKGKPNWPAITAQLNQLFHNGQNVRTNTSTRYSVSDYRKGKKQG